MAKIEKKYTFVWLFDVKNGNPNGDPDNGNLPRTENVNGEDYGKVTNGCLKRKIRDRIYAKFGDHDHMNIFVRSDIAESTNAVLDAAVNVAGQDLKAARAAIAGHYFDTRAFGQVLNTGEGKGMKSFDGPVQIVDADSVDPVHPREVCITKCIATSDSGRMGSKSYLQYGLYKCVGFVTPCKAADTGFNTDDLAELWDAIINAFELDRSAGRGLMGTQKLIVFEHESHLGSYPDHKLIDLVEVKKKDGVEEPMSFSDYDVTIKACPTDKVKVIEMA